MCYALDKSEIILMSGCNSGIGRELLTIFNRGPFKIVATYFPKPFAELKRDLIAESERLWVRRLDLVGYPEPSLIVLANRSGNDGEMGSGRYSHKQRGYILSVRSRRHDGRRRTNPNVDQLHRAHTSHSRVDSFYAGTEIGSNNQHLFSRRNDGHANEAL